MPTPINVNARPTVVLSAPWWNQTPDPYSPACVILERVKRLNDQGEEISTWERRLADHMPAERVELYELGLHADAVKLSQKVKLFRAIQQGQSLQPDEAQMARMRTIGYTIRVTAMTDSQGRPVPPVEDQFRSLPERDLQYLQAAIDALDGDVVPVLVEDIRLAERAAEAASQGAAVTEREVVPALLAQDQVFRSTRETVAWSGRDGDG